MALQSKSQLKDVFSGLISILVKKDGFPSGALTNLAFDWDMPVELDTIEFSQSEPTLNKTMVHGMNVPWCVTSTPGEFSFSCTVPTLHKDCADWFMGGATSTQTGVTADGAPGTFAGAGYSMVSKKLYAAIGLLSEDGKKLLVLKKIAIYATPSFDNASTKPFSFKLTGSIEATDDGTQDDILFLSKP